MNQTMRQQRWWQHLSSALLLLVCMVRASQDLYSAHELSRLLILLPVVALMVLLYLAGPPLIRKPESPRISAGVWLGTLTCLWIGLVLVSNEFIWLAFVLWLLAGHVVDLPLGIVFCLVVLTLAIAIPWFQSGRPHAAAMIGPGVGMLFAFGVSRINCS